MPQKLTDDILRWTLEINGKPAQKQLSILEQNTYSLQKANKSLGTEMAKLEAQGKKNTDEYKALDAKMKENSRTMGQSEAQMKQLRGEIGITGMTTRQLRKHMNDLKQQMDNTVPNTPLWRKHRAELQATQTRYGQLNTSMQQTNGVLGLTKKALALVGFTAIIAAVTRLFSKMVAVRSEFEKYEAVLTNTLGSQKAAGKEMEMIKKFAAETPFEVNNLTDAFVRLVNQGFQPTKGEMRKMGDLASSTGKDFMQLTEAILDAQVGEFERLKEFGIKGKKEGDKVIFSFKGVATEINNSSEAIRSYILSLGDMKGVSGAMEKISQTLGGRISNMKDAWGNLLNMWGTETSGPIAVAIGWITKLMTRMATVNVAKEIEDEQTAVNRLILELTDANTQAERRKVIVTELKEMAPGIVASLDDEGRATMTTVSALREYNKQMINKIILARKDAEMQKQQERIATAISGRLEAETEVSKLINQRINATKDENKVAEYNTIVLNDQLTLLQKITQLREAGLDLDTESTSGFNSYGAGSVTDFQSDKVGRLLNWINQERKANEELNNIMSERQKLYSSLDTGDSGEKVAKGSSGTVSSKKADKTRSAAEDHIRDLRKMTTDMVSDTEKNIAEADDEFNKWLEERLNDEVMASLTKPFDISVADKQGLTDYNYWLQNAYDGQLEMLRDMHEKGLIGDKEYADKSTKITAQANSEKLATFEGYLNASMDLANVVLQFQEAAKNRELKAAGDDAKKKEEIEKQYAEKQKQIAIAQAIIQGVLEVAKIWTAANVNIPLGVVLTGIAAARTVASVALISSQKFDKGGYTPAGAWDEPKGTVHSNEWVGNRFAVTNPNVRQFLDVFDRAQRTGQIRSLNTRAILAAVEANRGGYAGGGYTPVAQPSSGPTVFGSDPELKAIIAENARAIGALRYQLAQGIEAFMVASKFDKFQNDLDVIRKKTTLS